MQNQINVETCPAHAIIEYTADKAEGRGYVTGTAEKAWYQIGMLTSILDSVLATMTPDQRHQALSYLNFDDRKTS